MLKCCQHCNPKGLIVLQTKLDARIIICKKRSNYFFYFSFLFFSHIGTDRLAGPKQPTLWFLEFCLKVFDIHSNLLRLLWTKAFPPTRVFDNFYSKYIKMNKNTKTLVIDTACIINDKVFIFREALLLDTVVDCMEK